MRAEIKVKEGSEFTRTWGKGKYLDTWSFCIDDELIWTSNRSSDWDLMQKLLYQINSEEPKGVWFVYGYDTMAYPMGFFFREIDARRYADALGYVNVKYWEAGTAWSNNG